MTKLQLQYFENGRKRGYDDAKQELAQKLNEEVARLKSCANIEKMKAVTQLLSTAGQYQETITKMIQAAL